MTNIVDIVKFSKLSVHSPPFIPKSLRNVLDSSNNGSLINNSDTVDKITQINSSQDDNIENITEISSTSKNCYFKSIPIVDIPTHGDVWKVYVTNIDSLKSFYIQNINCLKHIGTIYSALEFDNNDLIPLNNLPNVDTLIAARNKNGLWCRAKIKEKKKLGLVVSFIDFGYTEEVNKDLKYLPTELKDIRPMAYKCFFKNVSPETERLLFNSDLNDVITKYFDVNELTVTILRDAEPYGVELSHNGVDVLDILTRLVWEGISPERSVIDDAIDVSKRDMINGMIGLEHFPVVCIGPFNSTEHFYIETEQSRANGEKIKNAIEDRNAKLVGVVRPKAGDVVIAKSPQDSTLNRARVVLNYDKLCVCFLIDRGTFEHCSVFYRLDGDCLRTTAPVKIHCALVPSKKINSTMLRSMGLAFNNAIAAAGGDDVPKFARVLQVGSPCTIDLLVRNVNMYDIVNPIRVRVIHVENINLFEARVNCMGSRKIQDVIKCKKSFEPVSKPVLHEIYVTVDGGKYKRVQYMGPSKTDSSMFDVLFVDENHKRQFTDKLFLLPKNIANVKVSDIRCSLGLDDRFYSTKKFIEICNDGVTKLSMITIKSDPVNGINFVKLFYNNIDVETMMIK